MSESEQTTRRLTESEPDTRRLFFALWPDSHVRNDIIRYRETLGPLSKRRVPDHNLHLTLLFLGNQPATVLKPLMDAVDGIRLSGFTQVLDCFGWFSRARVAWLGGDAPPAGLSLVQSLERVCGKLNIQFDRRPWKPHVTLFRQVRVQPEWPSLQPLQWPVEYFVLVESVPGQAYRILRRWTL